MKKKKIKNPLIRRIPKELIGDWKKYLVVFLFLVLTIGFVSGMYVANESMITSANEGVTKYKQEDGHFELKKQADATLLSAIETGEKADVKQYYLDEAKKKLDKKLPKKFKEKFDEKFPDKFKKEFDKKFPEQFKKSFDKEFKKQFEQSFPAKFASSFKKEAYDEAYDKAYKKAYDKAYKKAYKKAYDKAYKKAYDKAWKKAQDKIEDKYADAEEKYKLNDPDFKATKTTLYENFFRNEEEDYNNDGKKDGTIRVFAKTKDINMACMLQGSFPQKADEIAIDRMHADNVGIKVGDTVTVSGETYKVVGLLAYVNYSTLHEKTTDLMFDALKFDVAMVTQDGFDRLHKSIHYTYAWKYEMEPADEAGEKTSSDNFMRALLTQVVVADNELEDYTPKYGNPAINFATDDMGSDKAMGGVLLDILVVIIAFIFAVTISNTIAKESSAIGTLRASGYTKGELVRHYLSMPVIVTLLAAIVGNILGYTVFKNIVVSMYYNSYSLPTYYTIWNPDAFFKTTVVPVILMLVVNLIVIVRMMQHTPLQFLRHDLKKTKNKKAMRLSGWSFFGRFRLRIMFQNVANYLILFVGIFFIMVMLAMAVGMPDTLDYYKSNTDGMMFAKYQYVLKSYEDDDNKRITTENKDAEKFNMTSLVKKSDAIDEEISVYGIADDSNYVKIKTQKGINFPDIRPYQNEFLDVLNGNYESIISLMSRQAGKSITVAIELSWHYLFNENINIGICANKSKLAREFLNNVKNIFLELPMWMQPGTITWNKGSIVNENAMRILTDAPSSDSFRGFTIGLLVVDELAFIKNDKWKAMKDSVIPSQSGLSWKKNIFISTANGLNHFFDLVNGAKKRKRLYNVSKDQKVRMKDGSIITLDEYYKIVQDRQQTVTEQA